MKAKISNRVKTETSTLTTGDGVEMQAYVAYPEGDEKVPGLMVFQEAFGVNAHIKHLCEMFAGHGYVSIAPELYHRTAPSGFVAPYDNIGEAGPHREAMTYETIRDDIKTTYEWLTNNDSVDKARIASVGYCMGGRVSYFAAMTVPIQAAVSYYGGGIAKDLLGEVKKVEAPLLLFWGGKDTNIPREDRTKILEALDGAGRQYSNVEFSDAGHGFFCDERPSYHREASEYALELTLSFLKNNLS